MADFVCAICGESEDAHHEFQPKMPEGCKCNPGEWDEYVPVCDVFSGDGRRCDRCEHDKACHKTEKGQ